MTVFLYLSAIFLGLCLKKSKACTLYITTVMILLAANNYQNADTPSYTASYSAALHTESFRYIGYSTLIGSCAKAGLSWTQYRFLFYTGVFLLLVISVKMLTKNVNMVLALYLITYYGVDVVQMKQHIANTIAFFAISYAIKCFAEGKSLKSWRTVLSVAASFLAGLMHFSSMFYLLAFFWFVAFYHRKRMTKKMVALVFASLIAVYGGGYFSNSAICRPAWHLG